MKPQNKVWTFETMTPEERRNWLKDHFIYEVEGLVLAFRGITPLYRTYKAPEESNEYAGRAYIELFLLHARGLIMFFLIHDSDKDTAGATDYLGKLNWHETVLHKRAFLCDQYMLISKYLAHLTYSRMQNRDWPCIQIYRYLMEVTELFLQNLPKRYCGRALLKLKGKVPSLKLSST